MTCCGRVRLPALLVLPPFAIVARLQVIEAEAGVEAFAAVEVAIRGRAGTGELVPEGVVLIGVGHGASQAGQATPAADLSSTNFSQCPACLLLPPNSASCTLLESLASAPVSCGAILVCYQAISSVRQVKESSALACS